MAYFSIRAIVALIYRVLGQDDKKSNYFVMHSGQRIDLSNLKPEHIHLDDIAHHLANTPRYGGSLEFDKYYSVARHCNNLVSYAYDKGFSDDFQICLLMHDASEAYLGDIVGPIKKYLPDYVKLEDQLMSCILEKFSINKLEYECNWKKAKEYDARILLDECAVLCPDRYNDFKEELPDSYEPLGIRKGFFSPPSYYGIDAVKVVDKSIFLANCERLGVRG